MPRVPVVLLTGSLGAGKSTLLRRILTEDHGLRIAVVENEFADSMGIESLILKQDSGGPIAEDFFELANGCLCCTQRDGLVDTLQRILRLKKSFDLILIETSGAADPGPVAASFWTDLGEEDATLVLDRVITVVDSINFTRDLNRPREDEGSNAAAVVNETARQICFADSILLNKQDLVLTASTAAAGGGPSSLLDELRATISALNPTAEITPCTRCDVPLMPFLLDDLALAKADASDKEGAKDVMKVDGDDDASSAEAPSASAAMTAKMLTGLGKKLQAAGLLTPHSKSATIAPHSHDSRVGSFVWQQTPKSPHEGHGDHHHHDDHEGEGDGSCCSHKEHRKHSDSDSGAQPSPLPLDYGRFQQWLGIVLWEKRVPSPGADFAFALGSDTSTSTAAETEIPVPSFDVFRVKGAVWLTGCPEAEGDADAAAADDARRSEKTKAKPLTQRLKGKGGKGGEEGEAAEAEATCFLVQGVHDLFDCQPVLLPEIASSSSSIPEIAEKGALVFIGAGFGSGQESEAAKALQKSLVDCCCCSC